MKLHHLDFWYVGQRMLCDDGSMWQLLHFSFVMCQMAFHQSTGNL